MPAYKHVLAQRGVGGGLDPNLQLAVPSTLNCLLSLTKSWLPLQCHSFVDELAAFTTMQGRLSSPISSSKIPNVQALALRDFLLPMLTFDPARRATAAEMLQHPWLQADQLQLRPATPARGAGVWSNQASKPSPSRYAGSTVG